VQRFSDYDYDNDNDNDNDSSPAWERRTPVRRDLAGNPGGAG
jgi:hypothetical protein